MSHAPQIDLNSDVGESFGSWTMGDDAAIMPSVSSANVACGFHAGDPSGIAQTCRDAVAAGVTIGAHVGYRDLAGFGRRFIDVPPADLTDDVIYQIGALQGMARVAGTRVRYVKPHGALYNAIVHHEEQAAAVVAKADPKWGETPCAFVELKPSEMVSGEELIAWCRENLARYKVPRHVVFCELPKTSTGKIQKFKLREMAAAV